MALCNRHASRTTSCCCCCCFVPCWPNRTIGKAFLKMVAFQHEKAEASRDERTQLNEDELVKREGTGGLLLLAWERTGVIAPQKEGGRLEQH